MHRQSAKEDLSGAFGTGLGEHWLSLVSTAGYGNSSRMVYWTRVSNALNRTCPRRSLEQTDASSMMTADLTGIVFTVACQSVPLEAKLGAGGDGCPRQ